MSTARSNGRIATVAFSGAAVVLAALYFFQSSTLAPNHTDEGLILQYIDAMAHGELPYRDFVDAYGILNWIFPVAFYKAFGDRVWGVRMWLVVLKVLTLVVSYLLVRTLAAEPPRGELDANAEARGRGRFYGAMSALWTLVLVGAQWQSLETPYAFLTVMPLTMAAWYCLVCAPFKRPAFNVYAAATLTAITIWTKLNTGMYLLAGGLFTYFFWISVPSSRGSADVAEANPEAGRLLLWARWVGGGAYAVIFFLFMRQYFNFLFFLYLLAPLLIGVGWTLATTARREGVVRASEHLVPFMRYLAVSVGLSLAVLVLYYGSSASAYVKELSGILSSIRYTAPFAPIGKPGHYIGLNEYYWLELPWLLTASFALWALFAERRGPLAFGSEWPRRRAQVSSLFVLVTLHSFVMYARSDETHIYQALVLVVPVLFIVLAQLDSFLWATVPSGRFPLRLAIGGFGIYLATSLFVVPTAAAFQIERGDWFNRKLEHLRYRDKFSPYVKDASADIFDYDWDIAENEAAAYVKSVSVPGEEVLLLTANRLLYLNSDTRPIGGRYHFFFYLTSVGLLDREGFDKLVPKDVLTDILARPPRVIVSAIGFVPLAELFPEFRWLRDHWYEQTRHFRHILIYELRVDGEPLKAPLR